MEVATGCDSCVYTMLSLTLSSMEVLSASRSVRSGSRIRINCTIIAVVGKADAIMSRPVLRTSYTNKSGSVQLLGQCYHLINCIPTYCIFSFELLPKWLPVTYVSVERRYIWSAVHVHVAVALVELVTF